MNRLFIYGDFDWLESPLLIGELGYESLRGSDSYSFKFDKEWLAKYGSIFLSADINNYPGQQYTQPGKDIFGCFSDALPDRWGRTLLNRREQIQATEEKRNVRRLSSFDYLIGIDDFSRMGGFLFAGLIVVILASIAAMFVPAMQAGVSAVAALLFSGFILYDTSRLVRGEETNYVMAAVSMYLNVLNLFLSVLQLLGFSSND